MTDELIKQAPYLAAIVIIVYAFLRAQAQRDTAFLQAQADRDKLFLDAIRQSHAVVSELSKEVGENTKILTAHDSVMRVTAENLTKTVRSKK